MRVGYRPSPWTQGYLHPQNNGLRVQRREGEFGEGWNKVYREQTSIPPLEWLRVMQSDGAFDGRVMSVVEDVPLNRGEVLRQLAQMATEIEQGSLRQSRSACYRFTPLPLPIGLREGKSPRLSWAGESAKILPPSKST